MYAAEGSILFCRKVLPSYEMLRGVDYVRMLASMNVQHGFTNVVTTVPHVSVDEVVMDTGCNRIGKMEMV